MAPTMKREPTIVDASPPDRIAAAIDKINTTPGLRIRPGYEALWSIHDAPDHSVLRSAMVAKYGAFDLHFGWFCRRVAEELGAANPDALALVDHSVDAKGNTWLTLKPSVVLALSSASKPA